MRRGSRIQRHLCEEGTESVIVVCVKDRQVARTADAEPLQRKLCTPRIQYLLDSLVYIAYLT